VLTTQTPPHDSVRARIESWIVIRKPELSLSNEHFYLQDYLLDIFPKFDITQSFKTIIVVNPFTDRSMPEQLLVKAALAREQRDKEQQAILNKILTHTSPPTLWQKILDTLLSHFITLILGGFLVFLGLTSAG